EPPCGDLAVALVELDSDGATAEVLRGDERRPRAGERVENRLARVAEQRHELRHQRERLLRRVDARLARAVDDDGMRPDGVRAAPVPALASRRVADRDRIEACRRAVAGELR